MVGDGELLEDYRHASSCLDQICIFKRDPHLPWKCMGQKLRMQCVGHLMGPGYPWATKATRESMFVIACQTQAKGGKPKRLSGFPVSTRTVVDVNLEEEIRIRQNKMGRILWLWGMWGWVVSEFLAPGAWQMVWYRSLGKGWAWVLGNRNESSSRQVIITVLQKIIQEDGSRKHCHTNWLNNSD